MALDVTGIASFGVQVATAAGLIIVEVDDRSHPDGSGGVKSVFEPGEAVYFLVHHGPDIEIVSVKCADYGDVQRIGEVVRTREEEIFFADLGTTKELGYYPSSSPSVSWYGRGARVLRAGREVRPSAQAPCLGVVSYPIRATQYLHRPQSLSLAVGESWITGISVAYREVS